ncbi:hypothetical protein [Mucilaginibacter ginsenosidivorax]|uniref:Uncharacterized protein n=1 Tax=Mucilaginibacter ginsenosidivorax TaxID=862126 RepID=A0A5B8W6U6_9SPHI|nr:hypothetical protein [Mucilaginibacter ginsenosidivorax]QEC79533.1 hypothetical protein FSB76_27620 [Mucilaginibacter ginsenosidivorax]
MLSILHRHPPVFATRMFAGDLRSVSTHFYTLPASGYVGEALSPFLRGFYAVTWIVAGLCFAT